MVALRYRDRRLGLRRAAVALFALLLTLGGRLEPAMFAERPGALSSASGPYRAFDAGHTDAWSPVGIVRAAAPSKGSASSVRQPQAATPATASAASPLPFRSTPRAPVRSRRQTHVLDDSSPLRGPPLHA